MWLRLEFAAPDRSSDGFSPVEPASREGNDGVMMQSTANEQRTSWAQRWLWIIGLQAVILTALIFDWIPYLRGPADFPPEWRWRYEVAKFPVAVLFTAILAALVVTLGWQIDRQQRRSIKGLLFGALLLATTGLHVSATWTRYRDVGATLAQRTTVFFLEDFFDAARALDSPGDAFQRYEWLIKKTNGGRVGTHPPGMVWLDAKLIEAGGSSTFLLPAAEKLLGGESNFSALKSDEKIAVFYITLLKLLCSPLLVLSGVLLFRKFGGSMRGMVGRVSAIIAILPAIVMFAVCLDTLLALLTITAIWTFARGVTAKYWQPWAVLSGLVLFLESMLAYQVLVTGLLTILSGFFLVRRSSSKDRWSQFLVCVILAGGILLTCWSLLGTLTGFQYLEHMREGIANHRHGVIHQMRSRWLWLGWNQWDLVFFLGLAWLPWAFKQSHRCGWLSNPLLIAAAIAWILITLGDGIRGETARLILFIYPILACGLLVERPGLFEKENYVTLAGLLAIQTTVFAAVLVPF